VKYDQLIPCPSFKVAFSYSESFLIHKNSGCYIITNFFGEILYIGLSKCLKNRFCQHLESRKKTAVGAYGKPSFFIYLLIDESFLERVERTWMHQFTMLHGYFPILNKVSSPLT
jgi:hypothetical protein